MFYVTQSGQSSITHSNLVWLGSATLQGIGGTMVAFKAKKTTATVGNNSNGFWVLYEQ